MPSLSSSKRAVTVWLTLCFLIVAMMVIIGGLTRLTESGLSIVEWKPVSGILPPISEPEWTAEFTAYQASPQFKKLFPNMGIGQFKHIFWLEYIHRLLGRVAGIVFLLPLVWFAVRRAIAPELAFKLSGIFLLGFIQGIIGWFMVKTGLNNEPHVSPYMLAFHLGTGFIIFGLLVWEALNAGRFSEPVSGFELPKPGFPLKLFSCLVTALIFSQVILGAAVAGQHAGLTFNSFPLMDNQWIPEGFWPYQPWYRNLFEDIASIQFIHRIMAYILTACVLFFWIAGRNNPHVAHLLPILFSIFVIQFLLGVLTLLFIVPIPLASLHQTNALLLFGISVTILHRLFLPVKYVNFEVSGRQALA